MTICIVGTVVIGAAGLIIDNRLDKEEGVARKMVLRSAKDGFT